MRFLSPAGSALTSSFLLILTFSFSPISGAATTLPRLNIEPASVTVSGLSSGAFMAEQFLVAFSGTVKGAAAFAGGPYYCSQGQLTKAITLCMNNPAGIDIKTLTQYTLQMEKERQIDPLKNLEKARLFIFASPIDSVVRKGSGPLLQDFMKQWMPSDSIQMNENLAAEHGIPTLNYGNPCAQLGSPFLQNCNFDGIGSALQHLYRHKLRPPRELTDAEHLGLRSFDQLKLSEAGAGLASEGWLYAPPICMMGNKCRLHIAFHGCSQNFENVGMNFIENAGYLNWAIANDIVVLFPQTARSAQNPKACWDWFAYTGPRFATKNGPQMKAVRAFIHALGGF